MWQASETPSELHEFRAKVWLYSGRAAWHFVSVPKRLTAKLRKRYGRQSRGWNSLPVEVCVGSTKWRTSIFYDKKTQAYMLPIKAAVRKSEGIKLDKTIRLGIRIML